MNLQIAPSSLLANIPPNINWSVFRPMDEKAFEKELMKCIGYWASRLAWDSKGVVNEQDLRGIFGLKLIESYSKLHELFSNLKIFRKYIAVVCQNEYKDQLDKVFAQKNSVAATSSIDFEISDGEDGFTRMIDFLQTDDVGEVFTLQNVKAVVTEEEYRLILDHIVAGKSIRDLVAEYGGSRFKLSKQTQALKTKLQAYLQNWTPMMRPSTRPDRMRPDVIEYWNSTGVPNIQPFYVCEHLQENLVSGQPLVDFALSGAEQIDDRYGLCRQCWQRYWTDLMGKLATRIKELGD